MGVSYNTLLHPSMKSSWVKSLFKQSFIWSHQKKADQVYDTREVQLAPKVATSLCSTAREIAKPLVLKTLQMWVRHKVPEHINTSLMDSAALLISLGMRKHPQRRQSRENATALYKPSSQPSTHLRGIGTVDVEQISSHKTALYHPL